MLFFLELERLAVRFLQSLSSANTENPNHVFDNLVPFPRLHTHLCLVMIICFMVECNPLLHFFLILPGGTSTGVMKHVGEAVAARTQIGHRTGKINCIGIAPWGQVDNADFLISWVG